jgi:hypothetical protein
VIPFEAVISVYLLVPVGAEGTVTRTVEFEAKSRLPVVVATTVP